MTDIYDDPEINSSGDYVKFENVGDGVVGTIAGVAKHKFDDGRAAIKLYITDDDGEDRILTAGQWDLKVKLSELRPQAGDRISIKFTGVEKLSGGRTKKLFDIKTQKGDGAPAADNITADEL